MDSDKYSEDSFDELVLNKKEEEQPKEQDLTKMTRRQKQAYLVKNNIIEVTEQSVTKKAGRIGLEDETVLYSLDPSRTTKPLRSEMRPRLRKHKIITIEEQAEKQTEELNKILDEINRKEKERETKLKKQKQDQEEMNLKRKVKLD
jgi:hypothetical protein